MEDIARLIYQTDPYIYPYWFSDNVEEAKIVLIPLIKQDKFVFNYKYMYVAVDKGINKIVGLACIIDNKEPLDFDYTNLRNYSFNYKYTIDNYIMALINEVRELNLPYLSNVAIHHDYRGRKIGSIMLEYVIKENRDLYKKILLDVLSNNPSAIKLYQKLGFEITSPEVMGIGYGPDNFVGQYSMELDVHKSRK